MWDLRFKSYERFTIIIPSWPNLNLQDTATQPPCSLQAAGSMASRLSKVRILALSRQLHSWTDLKLIQVSISQREFRLNLPWNQATDKLVVSREVIRSACPGLGILPYHAFYRNSRNSKTRYHLDCKELACHVVGLSLLLATKPNLCSNLYPCSKLYLCNKAFYSEVKQEQ